MELILELQKKKGVEYNEGISLGLKFHHFHISYGEPFLAKVNDKIGIEMDFSKKIIFSIKCTIENDNR